MKNIQFYHYTDMLGVLTVTYRRTKKLTAQIRSSHDIEKFIRPYFDEFMDDHEELKIVHLNNANVVINVHDHTKGGTTGTLADTKLILQQALILKCVAIILVHNHPSGNLTPSTADQKLMSNLKKACGILDLRLLDGIIITREGYYSFRDSGDI